MTHMSEILFVDPSVSDLDMILESLRPEVDVIVLDTNKSAARQMAAALGGRKELDAVHVIAHGAPGRVSFSSGEWSAETLERAAEDLAAIGNAIGKNGDLRLWSCQTGAEAAGATFVAQLAHATGADVAAASGAIGAPWRGGEWKLTVGSLHGHAGAPLTAAGISGYRGLLNFITLSTESAVSITGQFAGEDLLGTTYFLVWQRATPEPCLPRSHPPRPSKPARLI